MKSTQLFKRSTGSVPPAASPEIAQILQQPSAPPALTVVSPRQGAILEVGSVVDVPISDLSPNPLNARRLDAAVEDEALRASLAAHGQKTAVPVFVDSKGIITLYDGHRRVACAKTLRWKTVRCEVKKAPSDLQELYIESWTANAHRSGQTPLDNAIAWADLLEQNVYQTQQELGVALGVSDSEVSRTLSLLKIPRTIMLRLSAKPQLLGLVMLDIIRQAVTRLPEDKAEQFISLIEREGLSARQADSRLKAWATEPVRKPRSERKQVAWAGGTGEIRRFESAGRVELVLKGLSADDSAYLQQQLPGMLQKLASSRQKPAV